MRKLTVTLCLIQVLLLTACGGGGGGVIIGGGGPGQSIANPGPNVETMIVNAGPNGNSVDTPYVTVTICAPGTNTCQTIDDIEVDTGSYGFRVLSQALTISLPAETDASGNPFAECVQFVDGFAWGLLATADVQIAGESAGNIPVQIIGDPSVNGASGFPAIPPACQSTGSPEDTIATFGAKGILGVGVFAQDCGGGCTLDTSAGLYYDCPTSGCAATTMPLSAQVTNPVTRFPTDNNGVIIELPAVPASGATSAAGALVFGIDTEGNNGLAGSATVLTANPSTGDISTVFNGATLPNSYFDTGSNAYYFADNAIATCASGTSAPGFFCPPSELTFSATNGGESPGGQPTGVTSPPVTFYVGNANSLLNNNPTYTTFDNFGAPNSDTTSFDFGLPFFLGRNVYVAFEGTNTSGGAGPFFGY